MKRRTVNIVSLGCSKNLVDSERLMHMLRDAGCNPVFEQGADSLPDDAVTVINTCGFIGDAKQESIDTILEWCAAMADGAVGEVRVMGCLSERYRKELPELMPEVTAWYGKTDWPALVSDLRGQNPGAASYDRLITTPSHHAYLKVSEGCNRYCAFCAIPLITGRHRSRPSADLVAEARRLASKGVTELNVIAQDLSSYGRDLDEGVGLAELTRRLSDVEGIRRIRLHYAYPADFPMDVLDVMAERPNVCAYLDIALQHISDSVLANMRRHITGAETRALLAEIRRRVPGIHIRTTLMVGFPGEGEREFEELVEFVREQRFERMGAFAYSEEEDTYAAEHFADDIPEEVKQARLERLMAVQQEIADEIQQSKVGSRLEVVIDREEAEHYVGRTEWDSPEVDPEVLVAKTVPLKRGDYVTVEVTEAMPFELIARPAEDR